MNIEKLDTEKRNTNSLHIDSMSSIEIATLINDEDQTVAYAVKEVLPEVAQIIDAGVEVIENGGKIFYIGAGTSGRLGVLDASECPPTYGVPSTLIQGLIAGGDEAFLKAIEGAEDNLELAIMDLNERNLTSDDMVIGIAASGRTPYVIGGLNYAHHIGAKTAAISMTKNAEISSPQNINVEVNCGPEVVTGSTRMKAGTAQKMILNMISTGIMVQIGKVYENLMVDVQPTNEKLVMRMHHIVMSATDKNFDEVHEVLQKVNNVKQAIVMLKFDVNKEIAENLLLQCNGKISKINKEMIV
ncbi:MAG: N-acetylmuramic acid 6-phosphate etherase [Culicoidibacterales bacterium]